MSTEASTPIATRRPVLYADEGRHGMLFLPPGTPRARVLLVTPLFEEKRCAHRALTACAVALAEAGAAVLIPDLTATGNSAGSLAEIRLAQWRDDLHAAEGYLRSQTEAPLCVIGCRAGALLAIHAELPAKRQVLWQPVSAGKGHLRQLRTRRMIQDSITGDAPPVGPHEVEGQELSADLFADIEALSLPDASPSGEIRLLQCSFNAALLTEYARLVARWGEEHLRTKCIVTEPFWNPHTPGSYAELAAALTEEALC